MIRNCALRASPGARIAPVVTEAKESLTLGSSLESAVESCGPLASSEAYQATRMRARATSETGRSRPAASYQRPPSTVTAWCSQAVAAPREVREADREPPSEATRASPACARQPYGVSPGSSKPPLLSEAKCDGASSGAGGGGRGHGRGLDRCGRRGSGREHRRVDVEGRASPCSLGGHPHAGVRGTGWCSRGTDLDELPAPGRVRELAVNALDTGAALIEELQGDQWVPHPRIGGVIEVLGIRKERDAECVLGERLGWHALVPGHQREGSGTERGHLPRGLAWVIWLGDDLERAAGSQPTIGVVLEAAVGEQVGWLALRLRVDPAGGGEGGDCERAGDQREQPGTLQDLPPAWWVAEGRLLLQCHTRFDDTQVSHIVNMAKSRSGPGVS